MIKIELSKLIISIKIEICDAICKTSDEVVVGKFSDDFGIDAFQGDGDTSTQGKSSNP
ncbi:MAG: hypothetical protein MR902_03775 [Campylobacter sp.]|nr:hypothetical protein [Campylobacter sp.]